MAKRPPLGWMALALVAGLTVGLLVLRAGGAPDLTQEALDAARRRWSASGPSSYELRIQMAGTLSDLRTIAVENGVVIAMTSDGKPTAEGSWEYWSVEGLFAFLQLELENQAHPPAALGVSSPDQFVVKARFHPELGYPAYFLRHLIGRQVGTEWEVVGFEVRP